MAIASILSDIWRGGGLKPPPAQVLRKNKGGKKLISRKSSKVEIGAGRTLPSLNRINPIQTGGREGRVFVPTS